jgi:hypothetical protein
MTRGGDVPAEGSERQEVAPDPSCAARHFWQYDVAPAVAARLDETDPTAWVKHADDVSDAVGDVVDVDGIFDDGASRRGNRRCGDCF